MTSCPLSVSVKCDELQAAADSFERALEIAEELKDTSAQMAIKKALEEVNGRIVQGVQDDDKDRPEGEDHDDGRRSVTSHKSHKSDKSAGKGRRWLVFKCVCVCVYVRARVRACLCVCVSCTHLVSTLCVSFP